MPWEALTDKGFVRFSVAGERENYRITTGIESFYNSETVYGGNPSEPPTPDQYDQLIALAQETKEIAESVREDANAGEFDGEPGKPGDPGKDGVSPAAKVEQTDDGAMVTVTDATGTTTAELKNGKDGNPGQNATDEQVQAAVDAYMEEHPIQGDTEDIIKLAIKNEASGAVPVVITDSADMGVQDLEMQGWTEQDSTTGAQLFDKTKIEDRVDTTHRETDTGVEVSGLYYVVYRVSVSPNTDMCISYNKSGEGQNQVSVYGTDTSADNLISNSYGKGVKFNTGNHTEILVLFYSSSGTENVSTYNNVMLNLGDTALPYEPYTGGQPSPNPDYPQEIVSAGTYDKESGKWEYEVEVSCGQLFDYQNLTEVQDVNGRMYNGAAFTGLPAGKYTIYATDKTDNAAGVFLYGKVINKSGTYGNVMYVVANGVFVDYTFDISDGDTFIFYDSIRHTIEQSKALFAKYKIMLCAGETKLPYSPYRTPQTVTLTSDRPLTKWDKLEKRNGQWGWVYKSNMLSVPKAGYIALDSLAKDRKYFTAVNLVPDSKISSNPQEGSQYCNICNLGNPYEYEGNLFWIYRYAENKNGDLRIGLSDTSINTKELFEQYISDKDIYIWYETAEETFVPLSESEQEALNALHTYYPTTMLSNDAGCEMTIKYIADTKAYIDSKIAAIQAAVINTI